MQYSIIRVLIVSLCFSLLISCERQIIGSDDVEIPPPQVYSTRFATLLDSLRFALDLPALAGTIVTDYGIIEADAVGCRRYGGPANVTKDDKFYIGSCGKAFTVVLIAMLIDDGLLNWNTTLSEIYPEYANIMHPQYVDATIINLLSHSAGFVRDPDFSLRTDRLKDARKQRNDVVKWALKEKPAVPRGHFLYSNVSYIIAGAIAEKLTDRSYEDLIFMRVLPTLNITSAGIEAMGTPGLEDQPLQHNGSHAPIFPTIDAGLHPIYHPAGMLHMSIEDWGKFISWVLSAETSDQTILKPETARMITTPVLKAEGDDQMALGWVVRERDWADGKILFHSGSNGYNHAEVWIAPNKRFAILTATNKGQSTHADPIDPAVARILFYHLKGN